MTVAELDPRVQDLVGKTGKLLIDGNWVEIEAVHARRGPMIPVSATPRL